MTHMTMRRLRAGLIALAMLFAAQTARAANWSEPVDVLHDFDRCVTYRAMIDGDYLIVRAKLENGWKTFAMDNEIRADERLAGKQSLGVDAPTVIRLRGLEAAGPWRQTPPKDFSKPEMRWYAFGFDDEALFAVKVKRSGAEPMAVELRGQACTDALCKNIDVEIPVPAKAAAAGPGVDLSKLVEVRAP